MKKTIINRTFSFLFALILLVTTAVLPVSAVEFDPSQMDGLDIFNVEKAEMDNLPDVSQAVSSNPSEMPIFHLWLTKGENTLVLSAFYVHDPITDGKYLVSPIAGALIENSGYSPVSLKGVGYEQTPKYLGTDVLFGYFSAPGLDKYSPFEYSSDANAKAYIPMLFPDDNNQPEKVGVMEADLSTWKKGEKDYIFVNPSQKMGVLFFTGSPVISQSDLSVFGFVASEEDLMAAYVLPGLEFESAFALEGGSGGSGSSDDGSNGGGSGGGSDDGSNGGSNGGSNDGSSGGGSSKKFNIPPIAIAIVAAVVAYIVYTKFIKKPNKPAPVVDGGTVSFDDSFQGGGTIQGGDGFRSPGAEGAMGTISADDFGSGGTIGTAGTVGSTIAWDESGHSQGATRPAAVWQLRGVDGLFSGKTFPVSTSLKIGRSSQCDIKFPGDAPGISGLHCEVTVHGDSVVLKDLGSSYGTFLSGSKLFPQTDNTLGMGDVFSLTQGGPSFRLEKIGAAADNFNAGGPTVRDANGKLYHADGSGRITFGRNPSCVVSFGEKNSSISGNHCVIYREGGKLYIKDTNSTNGTFFSEKERLKPNTPYRIRKGMAFFLTTPKYTFVVTED